MKNLEKRQRVMERSRRLGVCICDPKKTCPCDLFREKDLCLCAGERLDPTPGPVRLTTLVDQPGCASKIDQAFLRSVLQRLPLIDDPRVLVGVPAGDDAGVFRLEGDLALVQTVDVFTPVVDDPHLFGQIAAANSVSDIYAMGGRPLTALSILAFPARTLPDQVMLDILRGGQDKMQEARVAVIGGHSIDDSRIMAGFAVTGLIQPSRIVANAAAQPADVLILTKPLGTGIISFAAQLGRADPHDLAAAARSMATLNNLAAQLMLEFDAHACTDVTGFGLFGHLAEMARASAVDVRLLLDDLPLLPGVWPAVAQGILPGGIERNRESSAPQIVPQAHVLPEMLDIGFDAQTSGGLLIAVAPERAAPFLRRLHDAGVSDAAVIGTVLGRGSGQVFVATTGRRPWTAPPPAPGQKPSLVAPAAVRPAEEPQSGSAQCCCAPAGTNAAAENAAAPLHVPPAGSPVRQVQQRFSAFLQQADAPAALDARTKQALALALSVLARCEPCLKIHLRQARKMGLSPDEIDEAAWLAIAFGGSPVMMFYNQAKEALAGEGPHD